MTITERIFVELSQKKISQKEFALQIGLNEKTVSAWKKNNSLPPADKLFEISNYLGLSLNYLLTGKEPELSDKQQQLLSLFNQLSDENQIKIVERIETLLELQK